MAHVATGLQQSIETVYRMPWPEVRDLLDHWRENPPAYVSLHCLAVGMGCMKPPTALASEVDPETFDRIMNGE